MPGAPLRRLLAAGSFMLVATGVEMVRADCVVGSEGMSFADIDPLRGAEASGVLSVTCDEPAEFTLSISSSGNQQRRMTGPGGDELRYQLYTDPGRNTVWGDGNGGSTLVNGQSDGGQKTKLPVYGEIPPQSAVRAGDYRDEVTITVQF